MIVFPVLPSAYIGVFLTLPFVLIWHIWTLWLNSITPFPVEKLFFGEDDIFYEKVQFRWQKLCIFSPVVNNLSFRVQFKAFIFIT